MIKHSDNLCLILTNELVIKEANPTILKILGWKRKEVINRPIEDIFKQYNLRPFINLNKPIKKSKRSTTLLSSHRKLKISWEILPVANKSKDLGLIFIIGTLVSNLGEKEIQFLQMEDVVKYAPGFFYWKDKNSVYLGCNDEFAKLAGLKSPSEVIGKTDFELIWKDRAQLYVNVDQEVMKAGKPILNHEEKIVVSNNRVITAITNKVPLRDNRNNVVGMMGITTDITHQKITEEALSLAKVAAESANVLKTNFIQNMQHDIRTPASSVWAVLNDLVENDQIPDKELLTLLRNSSKQLLKICNDVIDFDKIEYGEIPILSKRFDVRDVVSSIMELNQIAAFNKGLSLSCSIDEKIPRVLKGDEHRLSRILINLMGNAVKFTLQGSIKITATLIKETKKNYLIQFKLEDTGIGIPLEKQNTLYEKFNRLNPANRNSYKGSGLGLRIVKKYIDDLEGEINVKSELNKGTIFFIDLPFEKALIETIYDRSSSYPNLALKTERSAVKVKTEIPEKRIHPNTQLKVLLIEDTELALKMAQKILNSLNYSVSTAIDVKSSLELLSHEKFDLVLSDIGLPDGTGIDLIKRVKDNKNSLNQSTPFFALTANADTKTIKESKQAGYLTVMEKPLCKETLLSLINVFMEEPLSFRNV